MNHVTADDSTCDLLRGILEPVEIRDAAGTLLGQFTPHVPPEVRAAYDRIRASINPTEARRRLETAPGQGAPLDEVLRRIEAGELPRPTAWNVTRTKEGGLPW